MPHFTETERHKRQGVTGGWVGCEFLEELCPLHPHICWAHSPPRKEALSKREKKKKETRCDIKNRFQSRHLQAPSQILTREIFRGLPRECVHLQSWETILDKPLHLDLNFRIPGITGLISQPFRVIFGALSLQAQLSSQNKPQSWFCYICLE